MRPPYRRYRTTRSNVQALPIRNGMVRIGRRLVARNRPDPFLRLLLEDSEVYDRQLAEEVRAEGSLLPALLSAGEEV